MQQFIKLPDGRVVIRNIIPEQFNDSEPIDISVMEVEVKQLHDRANVLTNEANRLLLEAEEKQGIIDEIKGAEKNTSVSFDDGKTTVETVPAEKMPEVKPIPVKEPIEDVVEETLEINP